MNVGELAADLELPVEAVLEACHRQGIQAASPSDELRQVDVMVLSASLATDDGMQDPSAPAAPAAPAVPEGSAVPPLPPPPPAPVAQPGSFGQAPLPEDPDPESDLPPAVLAPPPDALVDIPGPPPELPEPPPAPAGPLTPPPAISASDLAASLAALEGVEAPGAISPDAFEPASVAPPAEAIGADADADDAAGDDDVPFTGDPAGAFDEPEPDGPPPVEEVMADEATPRPPDAEATLPSARPLTVAPGDLPPTAVGSMPDLADELTPPPDPPDPTQPGVRPGVRYAGELEQGGTGMAPGTTRRGRKRRRAGLSGGKRVDLNLKRAGFAMLVAVAVLAFGNSLRNPWTIALCWLIAAVLLPVAVVEANRARYHISTHPEKLKGMVASVGLIVAGLACSIGLVLAIWTVVRSAPAKDAPLGLGDVHTVDELRWGFKRLRLVAGTGWERPAKDEGTCWTAPKVDDKPRRSKRVETGGRTVECQAKHVSQVFLVFAVNRQADALFPGEEALEAQAEKKCRPIVDEWITPTDGDPPVGVTLFIERPTQDGWEAGDHDVACVALTESRAGALLR
jgi:hypothetical protein